MNIKLKSDLFDLSLKKKLEPELWDGDSLRLLVKERLLQIAYDFISELEVVDKEDIEDIRFTGSLANYNYTSYSDIDLHVIVDFDKLSADQKFTQLFFKNKKSLWNEEHDIKIKGYDVELYVEDSNEKHISTGVYSVLKDKWIKKPKPIDKDIDKKAVLKKVEGIIDQYKELIEDGGTETKLRKLFKKMVNMRKAGLEKEGELSIENLAFKILRRSGIIKQITTTFKELHDKMLTLTEQKLLI